MFWLQLTRSFVASTGWAAIQAHVMSRPSRAKPPCGVSSTSCRTWPLYRSTLFMRARRSSNQISVSRLAGTTLPLSISTIGPTNEPSCVVTTCSTGSSPIAARARSTRLGDPSHGDTSRSAHTATAATAAMPARKERRRASEPGRHGRLESADRGLAGSLRAISESRCSRRCTSRPAGRSRTGGMRLAGVMARALPSGSAFPVHVRPSDRVPASVRGPGRGASERFQPGARARAPCRRS